MNQNTKAYIAAGKATLGIELGSTRIKAVLIGEDYEPIASGGYEWENRYENGVWTYHLEDVWTGVQESYRKLAAQVEETYGERLTRLGAIGISAMMHGYLAFGADDALLSPFRTWRNTMTEREAEELTQLCGFNIPQRWSIAHLWQAVRSGEAHVADIRFLTTLSGYVHWKLTGQKVLGVGDASGMFPIDSMVCDYDADMLGKLDAKLAEHSVAWKLREIFPKVLPAGAPAGVLTEDGAQLLDPTGALQAGIPLCPPEGDAGTGMVATNSVAARTGNVSAGTSIFAMVVLERALSQVHMEIDMVTTPSGKPVAMVHCNNCTSDINAWAGLLKELTEAVGSPASMPAVLDAIFYQSLKADADCGGLLSYNYDSGEPVTGFADGRPMLVRTPGEKFTLANFGRTLLYAALASLRIGMDILFDEEHVELDRLMGHGGFFKAREPGQRSMAAAMGVPVTVMETAGEGGAWGIALLAAYLVRKQEGETLEDFLDTQVFAGNPGVRMEPVAADEASFQLYLERYRRGLVIEQAAVEALR